MLLAVRNQGPMSVNIPDAYMGDRSTLGGQLEQENLKERLEWDTFKKHIKTISPVTILEEQVKPKDEGTG